MNKEELINELLKINIKLNDNQVRQIEQFCLFLLEENKKYNLTAIRDYHEVLLKHVYDSLTLIDGINIHNYNNLLDIGSGAGFPGIILKIVYPHLNITLLDSNGKKTNFLKLAKQLLGLSNLEIVNARAEEYINNHRESFDIVTARAVADLVILLELAIPFVRINGVFVAMKGAISDEIIRCTTVCSILNCKIIETKELLLPFENSKRTLVIIEKMKKTDLKYPRRYDQILKKPLKINKK